jgi:hypothetical protein
VLARVVIMSTLAACHFTMTSVPAESRGEQPATRADGSCTPGAGEIAIFDGVNFTGACAVHGEGDVAQSPGLGIANDTLRSVRVGPSAQALLCMHDDWGEPCYRVTADEPAFVAPDAISSLRVLPAGSDCFVRGGPAWMAETCQRENPRILAFLQTQAVLSPPYVISVAPVDQFTAVTNGREITVSDGYHREDPGMIVHELVHVAQVYPSTPGWLVEGIADYVRYELGFSESWTHFGCRPGETYENGYSCAATMLRFAEQRAPGTIAALHARLRTGPFDGRIGDRDVATLWAACADAECRP